VTIPEIIAAAGAVGLLAALVIARDWHWLAWEWLRERPGVVLAAVGGLVGVLLLRGRRPGLPPRPRSVHAVRDAVVEESTEQIEAARVVIRDAPDPDAEADERRRRLAEQLEELQRYESERGRS